MTIVHFLKLAWIRPTLWPGYLVPLQKLKGRTTRRLSLDASNPLILSSNPDLNPTRVPDLQIDNSFSWSKPFSTWKERNPSRIVALEDQVPTRLGRGEFVAKLSPSFASPVSRTPSQQFLKIKDRCTASGVTAFTHEEATPTSDLWPITSVRNQRKKFCLGWCIENKQLTLH